MPTSVPSPVFTPTGLSIPSTAAILAGVQADMNAAFGGNLNFTNAGTPQSQLAASMTAIIANVYAQFLFLTQMFDPQYAFGRYQDALGEIYDLDRNPAEPTAVEATCTGLAGTIIPVGALAQAEDGNLYACTQAGTIPVGGSIILEFACNVPGPIACPEGSLNSIYQAIPGWDSITNVSDGVIGNDTETRAQFEAQRQATLAANAQNILAAIRGAVLEVAGVLDCYTTENDTSSPLTIGGYTLVANSMYVAVVGGLAASVAQAIYSKKPPGCAMNGNTTVAVQDTSPPYVPPYPSYNITFEIPASLPILFAVTLVNGPNVPSNVLALVQEAITSVFAGEVGITPGIGATVYASAFYGPITAIGSWVQIVSIQIGSPNVPGASFTGLISGTTLTVSAVAAGALVVGQFLTDTTGDIIPGTTITAFGSGSGNTGTYTISQTQTVGSKTMAATAPSLTSVTVGIAQVPTFNVNEVSLTLQ